MQIYLLHNRIGSNWNFVWIATSPTGLINTFRIDSSTFRSFGNKWFQNFCNTVVKTNKISWENQSSFVRFSSFCVEWRPLRLSFDYSTTWLFARLSPDLHATPNWTAAFLLTHFNGYKQCQLKTHRVSIQFN